MTKMSVVEGSPSARSNHSLLSFFYAFPMLSSSFCLLLAPQLPPSRWLHNAGKQRKESGSSPTVQLPPHTKIATLLFERSDHKPALPRGLCSDTKSSSPALQLLCSRCQSCPHKSRLAASDAHC